MARAHILVVEDEHIVAKDIATRLNRRGYEVLSIVGSAQEAINEAGARHPDLVLMDVMLKGEMDGIAAADRIRELYNIPVVYLTAYADEKTLQRAKISDAFGYILKPFEERELYITIEMALYKHTIEARLRTSEQWLSATLNSIGDGIIAADTGGNVIFMNHVAEQMTGWTRDGAVGKPLAEIFSPLHETPEPGLLDTIVLVSRNGTRTEIDSRSGPIQDERGNVHGMVVAIRDVTEQRRAEKALWSSEERYRRFFEEDLTGDYIATADGALRDCNSAFARMLGYSSVAEAMRCNMREICPSPQAWDAFWSLLSDRGKIEYYEKDLIRPDGAMIHVVENTIAHCDEHGRVVEYKGYMFDNTERGKLEEQLRQSHKMESIGTLSSGIAHDFNNILNNVLGFILQIKKHIQEPEKVLKYSQTIEKSAKRGAELSSQLLSFARKGRRESVPVDVSRLMDEVIGLTVETFPRNISVVKKVEEPLQTILGDHGELYQVLLNLCVNARDAIVARGGATTGKIVMTAQPARIGEDISPQLLKLQSVNFIELSITDDGIGIPPAIREKIFDPFFTTKERGHGTGLGLSVVYNSVRNHHGTILVDSEEGKGTTFRVFLPAAESAERREETKEIEKRPVGQKARILIVDDEESMQELGRELLEEEGFDVLIAGNGMDALGIYRKRFGEIDLVILDLVMPGMDGGQTYLELKKVNPSLKAVFCTGYMPDQVISALLEEEKLIAIQKPFNPDLFVHTVRHLLDSSSNTPELSQTSG
jgi:two-component system, cell cycle sensor histidine kinase and response regulator CckA